MSEVSDLLGFEPPRKPRPPRQTKIDKATDILERMVASNRNKGMAKDDAVQVEMVHAAEAMHGVTAGWLATHFRMDNGTVKKRLRDCPPIANRKAGYVYDLKVAAQYLVKPIFNVEEYLKGMNPRDLPVVLQEAYWSGMRKKQQWEEAAGQLWPTENVLAVFGDVFQNIKFAMQLWPDNVERALGLTEEQRVMLINMCDALQNEIHSKLIKMPAAKRTPPSLAQALPAEVPVITNGSDLI